MIISQSQMESFSDKLLTKFCPTFAATWENGKMRSIAESFCQSDSFCNTQEAPNRAVPILIRFKDLP